MLAVSQVNLWRTARSASEHVDHALAGGRLVATGTDLPGLIAAATALAATGLVFPLGVAVVALNAWHDVTPFLVGGRWR